MVKEGFSEVVILGLRPKFRSPSHGRSRRIFQKRAPLVQTLKEQPLPSPCLQSQKGESVAKHSALGDDGGESCEPEMNVISL